MDDRPRLADLGPDLQDLQARWLTLLRGEQDAPYAAEFAPRFAPLFARLPLRGAPPDLARPGALISVPDLSWQPVAPARLSEADLNPLRGLSTARNRCEFEHDPRQQPSTARGRPR